MYHDEFAKKPAGRTPIVKAAPSTLPMEVGGGISLGLAAGLNPPLSAVLYFLGGLLPLVACSLEIAARRAAGALAGFALARRVVLPSVVPATHLRTTPSRATGPHRRRSMVATARPDAPGPRRPIG